MLGHDTTGVFSLKITNATLTDDATYECQVGPAPGNKPVRASARIGVLRKSADRLRPRRRIISRRILEVMSSIL